MANQVKNKIDSFGLFKKVIVYVKKKWSNLSTLTIALQNIIYCFPLQLPTQFVKLCFGDAMSQTIQYAIDDAKICQSFSNFLD